MAQSARQSIILTESRKFSQLGIVPLLPYNKINAIYTEEKIPVKLLNLLQEQGLEIVLSFVQ